jgi:hypothetical protein
MNRLEILKEVYGECDWTASTLTHLIKVMELTAKAEREACAKVCDDMDHNGVMIAADCAAAIRARSK